MATKLGRPTKYKKEYCQMLIDHMKSGLSYESFAAICNVCDDTLREWEKNYPAFSAAKREGFVKNRLTWEKISMSAASGQLRDANATLIIFNMKNRFPREWRDRKEIIADVRTTYDKMTDDELKERLKELLND